MKLKGIFSNYALVSTIDENFGFQRGDIYLELDYEVH